MSRTGRIGAAALMLLLAVGLGLAGMAGAKSKTKTRTFTKNKDVAIPTATAATSTTPYTTGKAESDIKVSKSKSASIKSLEVAAIVAPSSSSTRVIGNVSLRLVGPSKATVALATPFFLGGFPGIPTPPNGVGFGTGTNCSKGAMRWSTDSEKTSLSATNPNPATNDPSMAEFTAFPPYAEKVFTNLNAVYKGDSSKGKWRLIASEASTNPADAATLVCWSLKVKPQKPSGTSA